MWKGRGESRKSISILEGPLASPARPSHKSGIKNEKVWKRKLSNCEGGSWFEEPIVIYSLLLLLCGAVCCELQRCALQGERHANRARGIFVFIKGGTEQA
jgi:hypothetical protein